MGENLIKSEEKAKVLFIGNGINNINNKKKWENILADIIKDCKLEGKIVNYKEKPFPLLYEEIYLNSGKDESRIKAVIAKMISKIEPNDTHKKIKELGCKEIITTNYDYKLEDVFDINTEKKNNEGIIDEKKYNIFRCYASDTIKIWHVHGENKKHDTITLGYEHYCGQLQKMREYTVSGTDYKNPNVPKDPLKRRIKNFNMQYSWIDHFFLSNIHIIGFSYDTSEIDLWWLIAYRARMLKANKKKINNNIYYYYKAKRDEDDKNFKNKIQLLQACGVVPIKLNGKDWRDYYKNVFDKIKTL